MGVCTYVPPEKTQLDNPELVVPLNSVAVVGVAHLPHTTRSGPSEIQLRLEPPLPIHLMHQILLV
jgi:hypothetical protein